MVSQHTQVQLGEVRAGVKAVLAETDLGEALVVARLATLEAAVDGATGASVLTLVTGA